jgi:tetratricopeptide (TPR) repeat protein
MTRRPVLALAGGVAVMAAASAAHAMDIRQMCASTARPDAIRSCTVIISDGLAPAEDRIIAMRNRGYSYQLQGELDRAISDYNAAIKLSQATAPHPRGQDARVLAKTLVDRGVAWREKGDPDKALADFDAAEAADPTLASAAENRDALYFKKR